MFRILTLLLLPLSALPQKRLLIELSAGAGAGWWNYNKGMAEDGSGHLGWDHTNQRAFTHVQGNLIFKIKKWNVGAGANFSFLLDNEMLAGDHALHYYDKYPIAEKNVRFTQIYVLAEYDLFSGKKFAFSPCVKLGSFLVDTTHPRADVFGFRIFAEAGISNQIVLLKNIFLTIRPYLQMMEIWGDDNAREDEKHQILNLSFALGLRYAIF